jgi:hypothetical protein
MSSILFGVWHVLPTLRTLPLNPAGARARGNPMRTAGSAFLCSTIPRPVASGFDGGLAHSSGLCDESRHRLYRCSIAVWTALWMANSAWP